MCLGDGESCEDEVSEPDVVPLPKLTIKKRPDVTTLNEGKKKKKSVNKKQNSKRIKLDHFKSSSTITSHRPPQPLKQQVPAKTQPQANTQTPTKEPVISHLHQNNKMKP